MGLVRIAALLIPLVWALMLYSRRSAAACLPMLLLGIASSGYLLSLFSLATAGVWLLRILWLLAVGYLAYSVVKRKRKALPDLSLLLVLGGLAFLWWIARGRQFMLWDEFSHWGMAAKSLFSEGKLVGLVPDSGDYFSDYPPSLAPFFYLVLRAVGYSFREDLVLYLQGVFLLGLLLYPLDFCLQKKNPVVVAGGAWLLFLMPLVCYRYSYSGLLVDCLLGVAGGFLVLAAVFNTGSLWDGILLSLGTFFLSGAVKSTGIIFAAVGCLLYAWLIWPKYQGNHTRKFGAAFAPLLAALAGKLSWSIFCAVHGITGRSHGGGVSLAALGSIFSDSSYRGDVVVKFFANIFGDFNYGTWLHFPYLAWLPLLALLFWGICRAAKPLAQSRRTAMRRGFWLTWGFMLVFTLSVLFSYLFLFAKSEAVALASLSRYLNSPLTMLLVVTAGLFCAVVAQYSWKHQLAGILAGFVFWLEGASPSSTVLLQQIATAPTVAAESVNFNRSYRQIADWVETCGDPDAYKLYLVSQQDFGFAYIAMNYQLFPATVPDQTSSITVRPDADSMYQCYESPEAWANSLADNYRYLCLHNIDDAFAADFACLFDDPAQIQNGNVFRIECDADGNVYFILIATLAW